MMHTSPTNKRFPKHGLYAIADTGVIPSAQLVERVGQAIAGGAVLVQYRDKSTDEKRRESDAHALRELCAFHHIPLIINDYVDLAHRVGAAGVHLGKHDMQVREARAVLGESAIIGVSCYNEFQRALRAQQSGADYVAFGSFYATQTKTDTVRATTALLHEAKQHLKAPVVAIGGITASNGRAIVQAGADFIAAARGVFGEPDVQSAAAHYAHLFANVGKAFIV